MSSQLFKSRTRIGALPDGPDGPLIEGFAQALSEAGYTAITARRHFRAAKHFIDWAHRHGTWERELNEQSLAGFNRHPSRCRCPDYGHTQQLRVVHGARLLLTYLQDARIIAQHGAKDSVHDPALLSAFCQWMRRLRGSADVTLYQYSVYIRELLRRLGERPTCFDARRLRAFVLERSHSHGRTVAQKCTTALRMFLRFLIAEGQCAVGLDAAIPTPADWRLASLPRYLQPEDVERLIASCDRASAVGWRDRAILLLLARFGLRAGDVVHLRLSDIDWKGAWIHVCGKGRRHTRLPLTQEVGEAIVTYLKKGRPRTNTDTLFVRCHAPFCAFSSSAVSHIVDKAFRRAGVARPGRGAAHLLRHSLATSMLRQGASLEDIAPVLSHRSIETTDIYAKVDINALRQIAQPWPEA
ncbi:MAG: site-specific integrase [Bryobacteraceae bacterium]